MANWQVWAIILVGLGLLAWGLMSQTGTGPESIGGVIKDRTQELLGGESGVPAARNVTVSGTFSPTKLDLSGSPSETLVLEYNSASSGLTVNGVRIAAEEDVRITVEEYVGTFILDNQKITLDGTAQRVRLNGVTLHADQASVKLGAKDLVVNSLEITNIDARRFKASSLAGKLDIQDRVTLTLENEPLEMDAFLGRISLDGALKMTGKARRVFVQGQDYRTVVS